MFSRSSVRGALNIPTLHPHIRMGFQFFRTTASYGIKVLFPGIILTQLYISFYFILFGPFITERPSLMYVGYKFYKVRHSNFDKGLLKIEDTLAYSLII